MASNDVIVTACTPLTTVSAVHQWYALQIRYRFEKKALAHLSRKGLETFLPSHMEIHRWTDRRQTIEVPLFSGYGFVQTNLSEAVRLHVLQTEGVIGLVTTQGKAVPIPAKQIEDLRLLVSQRIPCAIHSVPEIGQRVRIRGGCLDGVEGVLASTHADRMFISVNTLDRSVAICIKGYSLEAA